MGEKKNISNHKIQQNYFLKKEAAAAAKLSTSAGERNRV
jgi:hypothetical protein